jgi:hypothetical protein
MNRLARTAHSNHALVDLADSTYEHLSASNLSIPEGDEGASPGRDSSPAYVLSCCCRCGHDRTLFDVLMHAPTHSTAHSLHITHKDTHSYRSSRLFLLPGLLCSLSVCERTTCSYPVPCLLRSIACAWCV